MENPTLLTRIAPIVQHLAWCLTHERTGESYGCEFIGRGELRDYVKEQGYLPTATLALLESEGLIERDFPDVQTVGGKAISLAASCYRITGRVLEVATARASGRAGTYPNRAMYEWVNRRRGRREPQPWDEVYDELRRLAAGKGWDVPPNVKALQQGYSRYLQQNRT